MAVGDILGPAQEVDCGCTVRVERTILFDPTGWNHRVTACLSCGAVSLVEALVEEPRPHDVHCLGHRVLPLSPALHDWFDAWPRYAFGLHGRARDIYLARTLRVRDAAGLAAAEEEALLEQAALPPRRRLERLGYPATPPPEPLPGPLRPYAEVHAGLGLGIDTPTETLLRVGQGQPWALSFALPLLCERPEYPGCVEAWLDAPDRERRRAALAIVAAARLSTPRVLATLERLIRSAARDEPLYGLINIAWQLAPASAVLAPALRAEAKRIGDSDYYLTKSLNGMAAALESGRAGGAGAGDRG